MSRKKENIEQQNSEEPENNQELPVSADIENPQQFSQSSNPEIMDIHAQHLHKAPGERAWHYFFEFLMLFLAITLSFFVENLREKHIENLRAKEYAQSLYDDLKTDTAIIQRTYNEKKWIMAKFDSVGKMLESKDLKYNEFIYYVERYIIFNDVFISQDVTYQQLRNSGNFRYIKDIALYKKIAEYYSLYNRYQSIDGSFGFAGKDDMSDLESKLFNPKDLTNLDNENASTFYDLVKRPKGKLTPIITDEQNLKLLYLKFANASNRTYGSILFLGWLKVKATGLMNELKKEYQLE